MVRPTGQEFATDRRVVESCSEDRSRRPGGRCGAARCSVLVGILDGQIYCIRLSDGFRRAALVALKWIVVAAGMCAEGEGGAVASLLKSERPPFFTPRPLAHGPWPMADHISSAPGPGRGPPPSMHRAGVTICVRLRWLAGTGIQGPRDQQGPKGLKVSAGRLWARGGFSPANGSAAPDTSCGASLHRTEGPPGRQRFRASSAAMAVAVGHWPSICGVWTAVVEVWMPRSA